MSKKNVETAINDYVQTQTGGKSFPTGWVRVISLVPPTGDNSRSDSYLTVSSEGLPLHAQMGLMEVAKSDVRNTSMLGMFAKFFGGRNSES